eukprot:1207427-Amphidinium_carterae.2
MRRDQPWSHNSSSRHASEGLHLNDNRAAKGLSPNKGISDTHCWFLAQFSKGAASIMIQCSNEQSWVVMLNLSAMLGPTPPGSFVVCDLCHPRFHFRTDCDRTCIWGLLVCEFKT